MKRTLLTLCFLAVGWALPAHGLPQPQVLDDFAVAAADGRPVGWQVIAIGGTAELRWGEEVGSLRLSYNLTAADGQVFLLRRARLREMPWEFELTCRSPQGGQQLGVLLRDAVDGEYLEYLAEGAPGTAGWGDVVFPVHEAKPARAGGAGDGKPSTLPGGGGLHVMGLTLRRGQGPASGELELDEFRASVDVERDQTVMIDLVCSRFDGLHGAATEAQPEALLNQIGFETQQAELRYTIVDGAGSEVGRGNQQVKLVGEELTRAKLDFRPRGEYGHFTVRAELVAGNLRRNATARFCVLPEVPQGVGRTIGVGLTRTEAPLLAWRDRLVWQMLKRAGVGYGRIELNWAEYEPNRGQRRWTALDPLLSLARELELPLMVQVSGAPTWLGRERKPGDGDALASFVTALLARGPGQIIGIELWREPDRARDWAPAPQPYNYRNVLAACQKATAGKAVLITGGLQLDEPKYAAALMLREPYPFDYLGLAAVTPRHPPLARDSERPSQILGDRLRVLNTLCSNTGRRVPSLWAVNVGVRTSAEAESRLAQAQELARVASLLRGNGGGLAWSSGLDGETADDRYGLIRLNLEPKESLAVLAANAWQLHGARPLGVPRTGPAGTSWVLRSETGLVAVAYALTGSGRLAPSGEFAARDLWGNPVTGTSFTVGASPIYISGSGAATLLR